ncbi:FtsK/SpoIIIE domain-containing protein [Streptomyces pactum]|uniref:FtsK/SpoIIIE domain-containing protein n=1 Tax=Streptomyces pactum TaxID=68249 RepID=UPI003FD6ECAA
MFTGPAARAGEPAGGVELYEGVATVDAVSAAWAERFARALAPLRPSGAAYGAGAGRGAAALPATARLLDELGLARATPASLLARWAAAADEVPTGGRTLAVLGAGVAGPLSVDLAADGPHLLIDGGPGTGKTELLRSVAASLSAAERPDRLAMVLVDGGGAERGEGLRVCTDLPHVSTYLAASDPVRMREFAQALAAELKRRAELLGRLDFVTWHAQQRDTAPRVIAPRRPGDTRTAPDARPAPDAGGAPRAGAPGTRSVPAALAASGRPSATDPGAGRRPEAGGPPQGSGGDLPGTDGAAPPSGTGHGHGHRGDLETPPSSTLKLRPGRQSGAAADAGRLTARTALPRLVVLVDDFDALVAPALGSPGRPAAGSVVRALEAVARDGARLGVHLVAASGRPDRTAETAAVEHAGLRITLEPSAPTEEPGRPDGTAHGDGGPGHGDGPGRAADHRAGGATVPGRGRLHRPDDAVATPFQAGRVTGRIPRTATQRPTVVPLDWTRMGDPPTRRPVRELGNGPTDLALLASALQRAAQSAQAPTAPALG